jgi:hypothetical protein
MLLYTITLLYLFCASLPSLSPNLHTVIQLLCSYHTWTAFLLLFTDVIIYIEIAQDCLFSQLHLCTLMMLYRLDIPTITTILDFDACCFSKSA